MATQQQRYFGLQGKCTLYERTSSGKKFNGVFIGNVSELETNIETEQFGHQESYTGKRFTDLRVTRGRKAMFSMTMESFESKNLALAFYGLQEDFASGTASGEAHSASPGYRVKLNRINLTAIASVTNVGGSSTYAAGTDYEVDLKSGTLIIPSGSSIPATSNGADNIEVNYSYGASEKIKVLARETLERAFVFEGLNTVDGDKPVVVTAHRVSIDPAQQLELINNGNEVSNYQIELEVLFDECQTDEDDRFFSVEQTAQV